MTKISGCFSGDPASSCCNQHLLLPHDSERLLEEKPIFLLLLRAMAQDVSGRKAQLEIVAQELAYDSEIRALLQEEDVGQYILQVLFSVQRRMEISESHLGTLGADLVLLEEDDAMPESYECVVHASRLNNNHFLRSSRHRKRQRLGALDGLVLFCSATAVVPNYQRGTVQHGQHGRHDSLYGASRSAVQFAERMVGRNPRAARQ
jgi:hypothetical protein